MNKSWTLEVEEDPVTGELFLQFPQELLDIQGWVDGDELDFIDNGDGSYTIVKVENKEQK